MGATTALTLAKMGYRYMNIYDADVVSEENTGTQLHKPSDIGNAKVLALAYTLRNSPMTSTSRRFTNGWTKTASCIHPS